MVRLVFAVRQTGMAIRLSYCDWVVFRDAHRQLACGSPLSAVQRGGKLHGLSGLSGLSNEQLMYEERTTKRTSGFGRTYFRILLDPTRVMQRLAVCLPRLVRLMMDRSTPRSLSGMVAWRTCDGTLSCLPAYYLPTPAIAPWMALRVP